jgi:hypothetical protein
LALSCEAAPAQAGAVGARARFNRRRAKSTRPILAREGPSPQASGHINAEDEHGAEASGEKTNDDPVEAVGEQLKAGTASLSAGGC